MPAIIQFVDSIASSPTMRLDINDAAAWFCSNFQAPPPRLRRSESNNSMRDGGVVGSASYENRTLTLELTLLNTSTEDAAATEMQKLWRELDRPANYLRYQREGMAKPVFFKLFRSDVSDLEELWTTPIARNITLELLAEPFALGLKESLGPFVVNNDPAASSNGLFFDVSGVLGDVPAEPLIWASASSSTGTLWLSSSHGASAIVAPVNQAEAASLTGATSNLGGGPDTAMSGAGTNNYVRTTFASSAFMARRLAWSTSVPSGTWRVLACVRRSSATGIINARAVISTYLSTVTNATVATELTTDRRLLDLGIIGFSGRKLVSGSANTPQNPALYIEAERVSGTSTIDWDYALLLPLGGQSGEVAPPQMLIVNGDAYPVFIDSTSEAVTGLFSGDPSTGTASVAPEVLPSVGGFPMLNPGSANRIHMVWQRSSGGHIKSETATINAAYWPRYLYVRPVTT